MILEPAIDLKDGKVVRLRKGDFDTVHQVAEDPVTVAQAFAAAGARVIHMVDLDGAKSGTRVNGPIVRKVAERSGMQIEMGGGIRTMEAIQRYVDAGVRRVVLGSALVKDRAFAQQAAATYGPIIVAGVDAKDGIVATEGWLDTADGVPAEELIAQMQDMGIEHLVYTDIARDGMQTGLDAQAYADMAREFPNMKITASGGLATLDDLRNLVATGAPLDGAITGRAIYEGVFTVEEGIALIRELEAANAD